MRGRLVCAGDVVSEGGGSVRDGRRGERTPLVWRGSEGAILEEKACPEDAAALVALEDWEALMVDGDGSGFVFVCLWFVVRMDCLCRIRCWTRGLMCLVIERDMWIVTSVLALHQSDVRST